MPRQSARDFLVTSLAAGVDLSLMRAVSLVVEKRLLPRNDDLDNLRDSVRAMFDTGLVDDPGAFFGFVDALEGGVSPGRLGSRPGLRRAPAGGRIYRRRLTSGYKPHPRVPSPWEDTGADDILFEHWVHRDGNGRGTVIALHGFGMGWSAVDSLALCARRWFELGLDVVLLTLPDHGPRRAAGGVFSGRAYTVPHALQLAGAVHRAVHDIFEVKNWLRSRGDGAVGLVGMSLGGYLAGLCGGLSADFDFLVPLVPPVCMGDLAWRVYRDTGHHRAGPDAVLTEDNLRAAFFIHSPLAHPRRIDPARVLIAAGAGDRIVPPEHPTALWQHWERPAIHWFRGSHVASMGNSKLMAEVTRHLRSLAVI